MFNSQISGSKSLLIFSHPFISIDIHKSIYEFIKVIAANLMIRVETCNLIHYYIHVEMESGIFPFHHV
jgi:hypothetical protein